MFTFVTMAIPAVAEARRPRLDVIEGECTPLRVEQDVTLRVDADVAEDAFIKLAVDGHPVRGIFNPREGTITVCVRGAGDRRHHVLRAELRAKSETGAMALYFAGRYGDGPHAGEGYTDTYRVRFRNVGGFANARIDETVRPAHELLGSRNLQEAKLARGIEDPVAVPTPAIAGTLPAPPKPPSAPQGAQAPSRRRLAEDDLIPPSFETELPTLTLQAPPVEKAMTAEPTPARIPLVGEGTCDQKHNEKISWGMGPIALSIDASGNLRASLQASIMTPIGRFSLGTGSDLYHRNNACMLIVRWGDLEEVFQLDGAPIDIKIAGVGEGLQGGADLRIRRGPNTRDFLIVEISGQPGPRWQDRLDGKHAWLMNLVEYAPAVAGLLRVTGQSLFEIEVVVEEIVRGSKMVRCKVVNIRRYWTGNFSPGWTLKESHLGSLPFLDPRDGSFLWRAPESFGREVTVGETYVLPFSALQTGPFDSRTLQQ